MNIQFEEVKAQLSSATKTKNSLRRFFEFALQVLAIATIFFALIFCYAASRTGSISYALPYLAGQRLMVEPRSVYLAGIRAGSSDLTSINIRVTNFGAEDRTLTGMHRSCGCISTDEFPIIVSSGGERILKLNFSAPIIEMSFEHAVTLFTDDPEYMAFPIKVAGEAR